MTQSLLEYTLTLISNYANFGNTNNGGSSISITFISDTLSYDFTISSSQAFGSNLILKGSEYCIYSGDVNQDGIIDGSDGILIDNDAANFNTGYIPTDLNGDEITDGSDALIADNNATNFVSSVLP